MYSFLRNREQIAQLIKDHGLTPTAQRLDIGEVFLNKPQHMSADALLKRVNSESSKVSKATVYNTLKSFLQHGLIQVVKVNKQHLIYDSVIDAHHHIYNEDTGELTDIDSSAIRVENLPTLPSHLQARGIDVLIRVGNT